MEPVVIDLVIAALGRLLGVLGPLLFARVVGRRGVGGFSPGFSAPEDSTSS